MKLILRKTNSLELGKTIQELRAQYNAHIQVTYAGDKVILRWRIRHEAQK